MIIEKDRFFTQLSGTQLIGRLLALSANMAWQSHLKLSFNCKEKSFYKIDYRKRTTGFLGRISGLSQGVNYIENFTLVT
jgi:hypothetical protein